MRWLVLVGVLVSARVVYASCGKLDAAQAAEAKANEANETHYTKALAAAKLVPVELDRVEWKGETNADEQLELRKRTIDGTPLQVILVGDSDTGCGDGPSAELVKQGKTVYAVRRQPKTKKTTRMEICDCDTRATGGCPVAHELTSYGYVLPKGMTYGGQKTVAYAAESVEMVFAVGRTQPCGPRPGRK